jgi:hypothetical protein
MAPARTDARLPELTREGTNLMESVQRRSDRKRADSPLALVVVADEAPEVEDARSLSELLQAAS